MSLAHQEKIMEARPKILVVDDEPFNLEIMQEILEDDYEVAYAKSGRDCMDMVMEIMPDVILLDVNMPGMSGYEVCQQLKENPRTTNIPVTFVSALDTLAERLAGYEVGGDDYICKPFEAGELLSKVSIAVKYKKERESLMADAERAMSKAMSAMKNTGDVSVLLDFMRSSLNCDSAEKLADLALYTISSMGLRSSVQIRMGDEMLHKSSDGAINQLERTVVKKIAKEDQIVDLGVRTVFNFDHVSVLIKNMPLDDQAKYGLIKNSVALLTETMEIRVLSLLQSRAQPVAAKPSMVSSKDKIEAITQRVIHLLSELEKSAADLAPQYIKIMSDLSYKMESRFSELSLTEEQEHTLLGLVDHSIYEAHKIQASNDGLNKQLTGLILELRQLTNAD
ncbi:MAG: response regulator [Gammaproteobacteria bacterium]|nr:response regulator [Gammaproteobacteria bacterium]